MTQLKKPIWLVCSSCGTKEALQEGTEMDGGCKACGGVRTHAEDNEGKPVVLWSDSSDPTKWDDPA